MALSIGSDAKLETGQDVLARSRARAALIPDLLVEAQRIAESSVFGKRFLSLIGRSLQLEAGAFLNFRCVLVGWPTSAFLSAKRQQQRWMGRVRSFRKTWEVGKVFFENLEDAQAEGGDDKKESRVTNATVEAMLPSLLAMAWAHNELDIAHTLESACQKVLRDVDAGDASTLNRRAQALCAPMPCIL